jgi:thioredoxin-related protein
MPARRARPPSREETLMNSNRILIVAGLLVAIVVCVQLIRAEGSSPFAEQIQKLAVPPPASAADAWLEDLAAARSISSETGRPILLDFTGSDWCGWCMKLDQEVFATPEFRAYAKDNLVLTKVDFPRNKPQSPELKKQNQRLQDAFDVQGYPTIVIVTSAGKKLGTLGYQPGGPVPFIDALKKMGR